MISSPIQQIKDKLDIVEVISGYIRLQKAGRNFKAPCPFHSEKTPSFFVSPERQIWHCFGCNEGGSIFDFVMKIEGIEFGDALRNLAQRAGVVLKRQDPRVRSQRQRLYEICELATKFFIRQLEASQNGQKIKKYLLDRGLKEETIKEWRLGYAPEAWRALSDFLKNKGYKEEEILKSGLTVEQEQIQDTRYYDRFRNRIIFPIFDLNSQIIGFAGRVLPFQKEGGAKYINTPQTLIYDKSQLLYGLDRAKTEIRAKNSCLIVEGYTDVLMSHQVGIKNVVASSGTSLTQDQLKIIKRYTENLILAFDIDLAGESATKRAIDLAVEKGFNVKIIQLLEAKDPADLIKENPNKWLEIIKQTFEIVDFYFTHAFSKFNAQSVNGKKEIAKILLPLLKKIPNKIEQAHWIQELARRLQVQEKVLVEAIKGIKITPAYKIESKISSPITKAKSRLENLEQELLGLLLNSLIRKIGLSLEIKKNISDLSASLFSHSNLVKIFQNLKNYFTESEEVKEFNFKKWQNTLPLELSSYLNQILFKLELRDPSNNLEEHLKLCLKELKKENIKQKLNRIQLKIKEAEENQDKKKLNLFLEKFKKLSHQLTA